MKSTIITLLLASAICFQACDTKKKAEDHSDHDDHEHNEHGTHDEHDQDQDYNENGALNQDTTAQLTLKASSVSKEQLENILSSYFSLKNALVKTDFNKASEAASSFLADISEDMTELRKVLTGMKQKENVEDIRVDFEKVSGTIYELIKANTDKVKGEVYKQYCPMAFNNKGAFWLSSEKTIMNPYFGDKMLKCGKVQETL